MLETIRKRNGEEKTLPAKSVKSRAEAQGRRDPHHWHLSPSHKPPRQQQTRDWRGFEKFNVGAFGRSRKAPVCWIFPISGRGVQGFGNVLCYFTSLFKLRPNLKCVTRCPPLVYCAYFFTRKALCFTAGMR